MHKLILKTATGIATVGLLIATMAPAAFAQTIDISGNGAGSTNGVVVTSSDKCKVKQTSNTVALTFVSSTAGTGGNNASGNTGGDVTIDTGDATSTVDTTVTGGSNVAVDPCCGCDGAVPPADITVSGNGNGSTNGVVVTSESKKKVKQKSNTVAVTAVKSKALTGKNKAKWNTGGTVDVLTGAADSSVTTDVTGGGNTL